MKKIIVNADDFGYSKAVNYGILEAYKNGIVTSTTIMANMPGFDHGINILKDINIDTGIHLNITCYKPLTKCTTLVDENGFFHKRLTDELIESFDLNEIFKEFCAQIDSISANTPISHIDSHHAVHKLTKLLPVMKKIHQKYNLPTRDILDIKNSKGVTTIRGFYKDNISTSCLLTIIENLEDNKTYDMMTHPAFMDDFLYNSSSYNIKRTEELKVLTDLNTIKLFQTNNIKLTTYRNEFK